MAMTSARKEGFVEHRDWVKDQGYAFEAIERSACPKLQWYKADGALVKPGPIKTDPYHMRLYRGKGWTLTPPTVESQPQTEIEAPLSENVVTAIREGIGIEAEPRRKNHTHMFASARVGSACQRSGCAAKRQRRKERRK